MFTFRKNGNLIYIEDKHILLGAKFKHTTFLRVKDEQLHAF